MTTEENFGEDLSFLPALDIRVGSIQTILEPEDENRIAISGSVVDLSMKYVALNTKAIGRSLVGFTSAKRMESDKRLFNYLIGAHLNSLINAATRTVGDLLLKKVKMHKFDNGLYFKELEHSAAYEFRIIVEKE